MSREEAERIDRAVRARFPNPGPALSAAVSEVRVAAAWPEAARAMRSHFATSLSESEAVYRMAIARGELWLRPTQS
jgi:hypothetical protein